VGQPERFAQMETAAFELTAPPMEEVLAFADRTRIHRRSYEMDAPACTIDRNLADRIMRAAILVERKSYQGRARYQHRGKLGDLGIDLLRTLLNMGRKRGRIYPALETLARCLRKDVSTIIEAMKRLIAAGFLTKHRRSIVVETPQGKRRRQDNNAYEVHLPADGCAANALLLMPVSDLKNSNVSSDTAAQDTKSAFAAPADGRFWLAEPLQMGNGSVY
jgi:hypothetical protein